MRRTWIALLLIASLAGAAGVKDAYRKAKRMRGQKQQQFAAEQAAHYSGSVKGSEHLYLGFLWQYAKKWDNAVGAFRGYLTAAGPSAKNRPRAMLEIAKSQLNAKKYDQVTATVKDFVTEFPGHEYIKMMRYHQGRARRAAGRIEDALESFKRGKVAGHPTCAYEVVDCLIQLGRYTEARSYATENKTDAGRWKTTMNAMPNLGQPMPKRLNVDFWMGQEYASSEIREKATLWSFWSTKVGNVRDKVHDITNVLADRYRGKVNIFGPAVYLKFNPIDMKSNPDMTKGEEQSYIAGWQEEYDLGYDLIIMDDNVLHQLCGVDPAYPALPAFAITDHKGRLRYVRVGPEDATVEALDAMLKRILSE
jgi:hypothetical protein